MRTRIASVVSVVALIGAAVGFSVSPSAGVTVGPGHDRELTSPAAAWWAYDDFTSLKSVAATLKTNHARPVDIHVTVVGGKPVYSVAEVADTGAYKAAWYLASGLTPSEVATTAIHKGFRPTVFDCYLTTKGDRCATIMVRNSGVDAQGFEIWVGTLSFIESKLTSKYRMIGLNRVQGSSNYAAIFVSNTGANHILWWWYHGYSDTALVTKAINDSGRIVDLDHNDDSNTWNAIVYRNTAGTPWYVYDNQSLTTAVATALQQGQRIFDVTSYRSGTHTYYATLSINDLDSLSSKVNGVLASKVPNGQWGFLLKRVGGSTLASLQSSTVFEPASTIKVLYHYKTIVAEQAGTSHDSNGVAYFVDPAKPNDGGICPDDFTGHVAATNLKTADTQMMKQSDNRMTKGVYDHFGKASIAAEATHLGMTHTKIELDIGCPTSTAHNQTTLTDLSKLYSAFAQSTDIKQATWRTQFSARMLNQSNDPSYLSQVCPVVKAQAKAVGKSAAVAKAFCADLQWISKGGSYKYGSAVTSPVSWSQGSLTGLPYKSGGKLARKSFFYGDYFDQTHFASAAAATALSKARSKAYVAAITPYITAALKTW